jgi:hypothetical protein
VLLFCQNVFSLSFTVKARRVSTVISPMKALRSALTMVNSFSVVNVYFPRHEVSKEKYCSWAF